MNEWAVLGVIITLVTFLIAICKPLMALTKAITELTVAVGTLKDKTNKLDTDAHTAHKALWDKNDKQDKAIAENKNTLIEHDGRIKNLERKGGN